MKHLFYLFVGILALYEILKASNYKKVYSRTSEYRRLPKEESEAYLYEHPNLLAMALMDIVGWVTLIGGLMTSQWILFLAVMILSLSRFQRLCSWAVLFDSIVTAMIYVFAIINTYHLHIPL